MSHWTSLISLDRILELHAQGMIKHNQKQIPITEAARDCVEARLGNAWSSEAYTVQETDQLPGLCFAGFLLFYLAKNQCFQDGNKRLAWTATMAVLGEIGLTINASTDEAYNFVMRIVTGDVKDGIEVVRWIAGKLESPESEAFSG